MPKPTRRRHAQSALTLSLLSLTLVDCTPKHRDLGELMSAEDGGTSGSEGTAKGGTTNQGGTGGSSRSASATNISSGGSSASTTTSNGGTVSVGGTTSVSSATATGGSSAAGATSTHGGASSSGGSSAGGATSSTGGASTSGGTSSAGGTTSTATTALVGPSVVITAATVGNGASSNLTTASFAFGSSPAGATKYECRVSPALTYSDCTSSLSLTNLVAGKQSFDVRAYNAANIAGPVLTRSWELFALPTTIKTLRSGTVPVDTLATISTGVRVTGMHTVNGNDLVFVQEAELKFTTSIDDANSLAGDPILNSAILTRPASPLTLSRAPGFTVTVTGVLKNLSNNLELVRATYNWGTLAPAYTVPSLRTADVLDERLEGVRLKVSGDIPQTNCTASICNSPSGNTCIQACFNTPSCAPIAWTQIAGTTTKTGDGVWEGYWVQNGNYRMLWVVDSYPASSDVCL